MDNPAGRSLIETIRKLNEMGRGAGSSDPSVEDYLRTVSSDPVTEWFTALLREKNEELEKERQGADRVARALRSWYARNDRVPEESASEAELQLVNLLRSLGIVDP